MLTYDLESGKAQKRRRIRRAGLITMALAIAVLLVTGIYFLTDFQTLEAPQESTAVETETEEPEALSAPPPAAQFGSSKVTQYRRRDGSSHSEYEIQIMNDITTKGAIQSDTGSVLKNRRLGSWRHSDTVAQEEVTSPRAKQMYVLAVVPH